jgi:ABC-type Fe3+-siderophore transport system permease subunit
VDIKKSSYVRKFIVTCGVGIGFAITFFMFGLDIFHSLPDFIKGLMVLLGFALVMLLLKVIFRWININDMIAGVQMGIVVRCWVPIFKLPWKLNFFDSLTIAAIYFVFGFVILLLGYLISRQRKKK